MTQRGWHEIQGSSIASVRPDVLSQAPVFAGHGFITRCSNNVAVETSMAAPSLDSVCDCELCAPDDWKPHAVAEARVQLDQIGNYPSIVEPPHFSPLLLLLDTCMIQNFAWARSAAPLNDEVAWSRVAARYGAAMTEQLKATTGLLLGAEETVSIPEEGSPFVVSWTSYVEIGRAPESKRPRLLDEWALWRSRAWSSADPFDPFCELRLPHPVFSPVPEQPIPGQLPLLDVGPPLSLEQQHFGPFRNPGDVALINEALRHQVPAILTTDIKSFWRFRAWLFEKGLEVWRPTDLCYAWREDACRLMGQFGPIPRWP
jgi:hypothetical protein